MLSTTTKKLEMFIHQKKYTELQNKKVKAGNLFLESIDIFVPNQEELNMRIQVPGSEVDIVVNAEYLKKACEKIMKLQEI